MKVIANKYRLIKLIGQGGMGEVFLAEVLGSHGFKRRIAVKLLPRDLRKERLFREAFINEARTLAGISHPNLVKVFDFGDEGDRLFLCMEHIKGYSLRELINLTEKWGERIPLEIVVKVVVAILEGLNYIHGRGVIHGDLTPKNIMIGENGEFKILDFGLSRTLSHVSSRTPLGGKSGYLAPEVTGEKRMLPASDIYSLGAIIRNVAGEAAPVGRDRGDPGHAFRQSLMAFSKQCLDQDPEKRPPAEELLQNFKNLRRNLDSGFEIKDYLSQLPFEDEYTYVFPDRSPHEKARKRRAHFPAWIILFAASASILFLLWSRQTRVIKSREAKNKDVSGVVENERGNDRMREIDSIDMGRGNRVISAESAKAARSYPVSERLEKEAPFPVDDQVGPGNDAFEVRSYPDKAAVYVNGKDVGTTPLLIPREIFRGKEGAVLRLERDGFADETVEISGEDGAGGGEIFVTLKRATGFLSVNVHPWAYVIIDGEKAGTTPIIQRALPVGEHTLLLTNDKLGVSIKRSVEIKEGTTEVLIEDFYR
ncbi:MAG: protein kinase [Deltaproteobacteria bacterium]|nr:protein kinase [Deltaproteobacteria bacterium]NIS76481.1 protein kinase [Deltaproteobacteria bacterium]